MEIVIVFRWIGFFCFFWKRMFRNDFRVKSVFLEVFNFLSGRFFSFFRGRFVFMCIF